MKKFWLFKSWRIFGIIIALDITPRYKSACVVCGKSYWRDRMCFNYCKPCWGKDNETD